ncbi:hypothetical protein Fmac_013677 [Flemingia macrophylla]|uniref:Uncharacterized protein n=1 Tax=Flemingia macrophylla TaxID=520843 RepID=A0ABD1MTT6_9FABA
MDENGCLGSIVDVLRFGHTTMAALVGALGNEGIAKEAAVALALIVRQPVRAKAVMNEEAAVTPPELGILMRSLGGNPTQAQLKAIVAQENLTAPIPLPSFLDLMPNHMKPEPFNRHLRHAFKVLHKDHDKRSRSAVVVSYLQLVMLTTGKLVSS